MPYYKITKDYRKLKMVKNDSVNISFIINNVINLIYYECDLSLVFVFFF